MKKQGTFASSIIRVALVTAFILLIPFVAMQFTAEVSWGPADFLVMGTLIMGTGLAYSLLARHTPNLAYRVAAGLALGATFLLIWANLAVGLIGSGPNAGNLVYMAVVLVPVTGALLARFRAAGMERAMYATALALVLLAAVVLLTGMHQYPGSSVLEVLGVSGCFAGLFLVSGALFRYAARTTATRQVC